MGWLAWAGLASGSVLGYLSPGEKDCGIKYILTMILACDVDKCTVFFSSFLEGRGGGAVKAKKIKERKCKSSCVCVFLGGLCGSPAVA